MCNFKVLVYSEQQHVESTACDCFWKRCKVVVPGNAAPDCHSDHIMMSLSPEDVSARFGGKQMLIAHDCTINVSFLSYPH
jgi:hypothetical protein